MYAAVHFDAAATERIAKAAKEELRLRLEGLLAARTQVGPFFLYPLTVRGLIEMQHAENRLVSGEVVEIDDVMHFIYMTSSAQDKANQGKFFKRIGKKLRSQDAFDEVVAYFHAQFNDMPTSGKEDGGSTSTESQPFILGVIDTLANEYGWPYDCILGQTVSVVFQLYQRILFRMSGGKRHPNNPITQMAKARELERLKREAV